MHEYDVALKSVLMRPGSALLAALTGSRSLRWLNVEAPLVRNLRVDLLGESADGELIHIELQRRNERYFALRMGEYLFAVGVRHRRLPRQVVLYIGDEPLRMKNGIERPDLSFRFHIVDIRELDGGPLLASKNVGDNIISVLTRVGEQPDAVQRILKRIADGPAAKRSGALAELLIVARLRNLSGKVVREARKMPILDDIMDHDVFGPLIRQGRAEGLAEGGMAILTRQIEKRFGRIPPKVRKRLDSLKPAQIEAAALRVLDARSLEDLFGRQ